MTAARKAYCRRTKMRKLKKYCARFYYRLNGTLEERQERFYTKSLKDAKQYAGRYAERHAWRLVEVFEVEA
jgi:hypothetical protein